MMGWWECGPMNGWGGGGLGILSIIFNLAFWVLVVWFVVMFIRLVFGHHHEGMFKQIMSGKKAIDILKERYAKGEIDKKTFEQMKKDLKE